MNMENPVGQRLVFWKTEGIIIGVVKDYHHVPLHREIMPHIFTVNPKYANSLKFVFVKIASGHVPETLNYIRKKTQMVAPEYPFSYAFLDREIDSMYHSEQKLAEILGYFTMLAILISCMGIYALIAFTIRKKVREIGIRKVLGSSVPGIVKLLSHTFFKWIMLANLIAWPIGFLAMGKWLDNFAYRINLTLPVFVLATVLSLMVAAIPIVSQSVRAAFANPIDTIRYE
jgi:putative ABC transport system permease protein